MHLREIGLLNNTLLFGVPTQKQLGGKLGSSFQTDLGVNTVGDLLQFSEEKLKERYGMNTGFSSWLWNISRDINGGVIDRLLPKSHGSRKTFPGPQALKTIASVHRWFNELCEELSERIQIDLEENKWVAHTLALHARAFKSNDSESVKKFPFKSCPLSYGTEKIKEDGLKLFESGLRVGSRFETQESRSSSWGITGLSVSASKIYVTPAGTSSILRFIQSGNPYSSSPKQESNQFTEATVSLSPSGSESHLGQGQAEQTNLLSSIPRFFQRGNPSSSSSKQESDLLTEATLPLSPRGYENHLSQHQAEPTNRSSSILKFFQWGNSSSSSSKQESGQFMEATLPLSPSGIESYLGQHQVEQTNRPSVLRFFQGGNPSSSLSKQESDQFTEATLPLPPSSSESHLGQDQVEQTNRPFSILRFFSKRAILLVLHLCSNLTR